MAAESTSPAGPIVYTLLGPTGAGKTALLETLAELAPERYEIVSCDSRQIYGGLEIGSAAPDAALCERLPHRLVGHMAPTERYSAARFRDEALAAIADIFKRGRIPFLVGGSGFYFRALCTGLFESTGSSAEQAAIRERVAALTPAERLTQLRELDPAALADPGEQPRAGRIHVNDDYRIGRALEICLSGGPLYSERWQAAAPRFAEAPAGQSAADAGLADQLEDRPEYRTEYSFRGWRLEVERESYWPRLNDRAGAMVAAGVAAEAGRVFGEYGDCPGLATLGYAEALQSWRGELSAAALQECLFIAHRQYGKRQRTWLRREHALQAIFAEELLERLQSADGELARLL